VGQAGQARLGRRQPSRLPGYFIAVSTESRRAAIALIHPLDKRFCLTWAATGACHDVNRETGEPLGRVASQEPAPSAPPS